MSYHMGINKKVVAIATSERFNLTTRILRYTKPFCWPDETINIFLTNKEVYNGFLKYPYWEVALMCRFGTCYTWYKDNAVPVKFPSGNLECKEEYKRLHVKSKINRPLHALSSEGFRNEYDRREILKRLAIDGMEIRLANNGLQEDIELIVAAVNQNIKTLYFSEESLRIGYRESRYSLEEYNANIEKLFSYIK